MLNWASKECQFDEAAGSGLAIWAPPAASRGKAAGRFMVFPHFWNMQNLTLFIPIAPFFIAFWMQSASKEHVKHGILWICQKNYPYRKNYDQDCFLTIATKNYFGITLKFFEGFKIKAIPDTVKYFAQWGNRKQVFLYLWKKVWMKLKKKMQVAVKMKNLTTPENFPHDYVIKDWCLPHIKLYFNVLIHKI